uniref:Cytochrome b561 bacterial/Ni-hydrogenase domain-containing protein n=1 Tax=Anopheles coluzzii TaxID=1518534 RepID=A0A8W7PU77_ANOCL
MKKLLLTALFAAFAASAAFAGAKCETHPKSEWIKQEDFKKQLEGQGYKIDKFKVSGQCYEIYGKNKDDKKVEIYFDTKTGKPVKSPHRWAGYLAAALVLSRVLWGFVGSKHARFADFFPTPRRLRAHWQDMRQGRLDAHAGHNPLGALMMLWLMALVLGLGVTGYLLGTDAFWGDDRMQELHEALANILIGSVGLHVLAALVMSRLGGINL